MEISTIDLQNYRNNLIRMRKAVNTINNRIAVLKAMYNWALANEVIGWTPNLNAIRKIPKMREEKPTFSVRQVGKLLKNASAQTEAMIWLGLNCGFGCTDCAELRWENLDLISGRVSFPRGKTGIARNLPLWPETIKALRNVPRRGPLVFYTVKGNQ
jgi:integrase